MTLHNKLMPALAALLALTGGQEVTAQDKSVVTGDGSSAVAPISIAVAEKLKADQGINVVVATSGTGGGFKKFCSGETDISNASRPIKDSEIEACQKNGINFVELPIAFDGLAFFVGRQNDFVECLSIDELKKIWGSEAEGNVYKWNQVRDSFPSEPLLLFMPGTDSGDFDYFEEVVLGEGIIRADVLPSEDDNILLEGVSRSEKRGLGFFSFSYYKKNEDRLTSVAIDGGSGCVTPSSETIQNGTYFPFSRPLFIYVNTTSLARSEVKDFVDYYLNKASEVAPQLGYVPLPPEVYTAAKARAQAITTGSVFKDLKPGTSMQEVFK